MNPPLPQGLSAKEASKRLEEFGFNELRLENKESALLLFAKQFHNSMVYILILAVLVSAFLQEWVDAIAISIILFLNAIVGFLQEYKAEKALEALKKLEAPFARVIRDGKDTKIPARELVPGDHLILEEGSKIPADAVLVESSMLQVMESILTGESMPVMKKVGDKIFMGTIVTQGHGQAILEKTGMNTEFGQLSHMVQNAEVKITPLRQSLNTLTRALSVMVISLAILLFLSSFVTGNDPHDVFMLSISLVVGAIPEGLPAVITLTLALGVQRMAKHKALIRKLDATETLGSLTVICTDKTGTLTKNEMTVQKLWLAGETLHVSGEGYAPQGEIIPEGNKAIPQKEFHEMLEVAVLCNNAHLYQEKEIWTISGDPTEACLLTLAEKAGVSVNTLREKAPKKEEWVFDSKRKKMSSLHLLHDENWVLMKGAPESVLESCKISPEEKKKILAIQEAWASEALRVLAFARKKIPATSQKWAEEDMEFLGLVGMMDPPRKEVKEAIRACKYASVKVIMVTGDHALTARAIGKAIGLTLKEDLVLTGENIDTLSDKALQKELKDCKIFARVAPKHKVRILKALQDMGHVVGMTGDGVNDAPALKNANVGIAMGITGSDVSKEASAMILQDDHFASIVESIRQGRGIYQNIQKSIQFLLSANLMEVVVISLVFMAGFPTPLLPLHLLWMNLLTDALPALALGVEPVDSNIMNLKPKPQKLSIYDAFVKKALAVGLMGSVFALALYAWYYGKVSELYLQSMILHFMVIFELCLVFAMKSDHEPLQKIWRNNPALLGAVGLSLLFQVLALYHPFFQHFLKTEALFAKDWLVILGLSALGLVMMELQKNFAKAKTHV